MAKGTSSKNTFKGTENEIQNARYKLDSTRTAIATVQNAIGIMHTETDVLQALRQRLIYLKDEMEEQYYKKHNRQTAVICWMGERYNRYGQQAEEILQSHQNILYAVNSRLDEVNREISRKEAMLCEKRNYIGQLQINLQNQQAVLKRLCGR